MSIDLDVNLGAGAQSESSASSKSGSSSGGQSPSSVSNGSGTSSVCNSSASTSGTSSTGAGSTGDDECVDCVPVVTKEGHVVEREFANLEALKEAVVGEVFVGIEVARVAVVPFGDGEDAEREISIQRFVPPEGAGGQESAGGRWAEMAHGGGDSGAAAMSLAWCNLVTSAQPKAWLDRQRCKRAREAMADVPTPEAGEEGGSE